MSTRISLPSALIALSALAVVPLASADNSTIYLVQKAENYFQGSSGGATAVTQAPFTFLFQAPVACTYTPPGGSATTPVFNSNNDDYETNQGFASEVALNAAFPDGAYQLNVPTFSTVDVAMTGSDYPTALPQINSGGTWLPGGILAINPASAVTLNLANFTGYSSLTSPQIAGHMQLKINDITPGNITQTATLKMEIATQAVFGLTQASSPFTSYLIPASTLSAGHLYAFSLTFDALTDLDTTSLAAAGIVGIYTKDVTSYIVAQSQTTAQDTAPSITTQPTNQSVPIGGSAVFSIGENFDNNTTAILYFNGTNLNIGGNTSKYGFVTTNGSGVQLTINNVAATDAGTYYAVFVNPGGVVATQTATLTATAPAAPSITTDLPTSQSLNQGSTIVFTPVFSPLGPPTTYQWYENGTLLTDSPNGTTTDIIAGSSGPQLEISNASAASSATFYCIASNVTGMVQTASDVVTVSATSTPGALVNISSRALVETGDNILIGGFYLVGTTSRTVLIQAVGPGLTSEGVQGALQQPVLSIYNTSGQEIYTNTNWTTNGENQQLLSAAATVYASPVFQTNLADSELLLTLQPGGYTAEVTGVNNTMGVALVQIFQFP
jgi:hypothetical protein